MSCPRQAARAAEQEPVQLVFCPFYRFVSFYKQRTRFFSPKLRRYDLVLLWTLALQNCQHGLGCTHLPLCPGSPGRACLPAPEGVWGRLAESRREERKPS